jgi:hypothetical protein
MGDMLRDRWIWLGAWLAAAVLAGCSGGAPSGPPPSMPAPVSAKPEVDPGLMLQQTVSLDVEEVPLTQVATQLGRGKSVEIVYDDRLDRRLLTLPVTLRLKGVTLDSALYWVCSGQLTYYVDENRVVLTTPDRMTPQRQERLDAFRSALERRWRPALEKDILARKVSCDLKDLTLADVADNLRDRYGVNLVGAPELMQKMVTVKAENQPMRELLDGLAKSIGASWSLEHEAVHFQVAKP